MHELEIQMKIIWEYISARAKYALPPKRVISLIILLLGLFHTCFLALFAFFSIRPMVILSMGGVLFYVFCYTQAKKSRRLPRLFNLCYAEILLYAAAAELLMGAESGFTVYMTAMLPLGYYASYNFNSKKGAVNPISYTFFAAIAFIIVQMAGSFIEPACSFGDQRVDHVICLVNYLVAAIVITLFLSSFLNQIKILENLRMNQNQKLEELSRLDSLTGLSNRRCIQEKCAQAERQRQEYALIIADIDDFKKINDTYGHNIGDKALQAVASIFKNAVRDEDTVCRWGGEEILIFLPGCPLDKARYRAKDILNQIRALDLRAQDQTVFHITMTFGVSVSGESENFAEALRKADERLYTGKRSGKNQVV